MTPNLAQVALELINRAPMKGAEAEAALAVKEALKQIMLAPEPAAEAPEEPAE